MEAGEKETMRRFITFEGIDGSGKSTIIQHVCTYLQNKKIPVKLTYEPTDTDIGTFVQHCIKTQKDPYLTAFSFIADRIQHCTQIAQWVEEGNIVLCDRYAESTYAYQGAQLQKEIKQPMKWLQDLSKNRILTPEKTFFLTLPPSLAIKRISNRDELIVFEQQVFLEKVHKNYQKLCKGPRFIILDATRTIPSIVQECIHHINKDSGMPP